MDPGAIRNLKTHYRRNIIRLVIKALDKYMPLPKIAILEAMNIILSS